jgi:septum site-determining protein MinC
MRSNPPIDPSRAAVIEIRYGQVGLVQVRVHTTDPGAILDELTGRVATAPHFFRRTGVCLDLSALPSAPAIGEVQAVIDALRRAGMLAVGLSGEAEPLASTAAALNLPVLSSFRSGGRPVPIVQPVPSAPFPGSGVARNGAAFAGGGAAEEGVRSAEDSSAAAADEESSQPRAHAQAQADAAASSASPQAQPLQSALIHTQPVRSGQRLYAKRRDLVVTSSVGPGAELMADGCVHVYGSLRGRAMAGAHGDTSARVFCQEFQAELISIAGVFRVFETIPPELLGAPVQAWLVGEELRISRLA